MLGSISMWLIQLKGWRLITSGARHCSKNVPNMLRTLLIGKALTKTNESMKMTSYGIIAKFYSSTTKFYSKVRLLRHFQLSLYWTFTQSGFPKLMPNLEKLHHYRAKFWCLFPSNMSTDFKMGTYKEKAISVAVQSNCY